MDIEKIGKFIKELRNEKKLTQKELADKLNITDRAVSKWERGKGLPDISYLEDLSKIFEVSILEILKGERTSSLEDKDIYYSVEYGVNSEKVKRYEKINKMINISVITIIVAVLLFNLRNIYYINKTYQYDPETEIQFKLTDEFINYNLMKTELIKNNQGIFSDEDYKYILQIVKHNEKYLRNRLKEDFYGKYKFKDFNFELPSTYITDILLKYDKNILKNKMLYFHDYNDVVDMTNFSEKLTSNFYQYKIDANDYTIEYLLIVEESTKHYGELLDLIIEVGEIHE